MIQHQGIYLPDCETHLQGWMTRQGEIVDGRGTYQIQKLRKALSFCKQFRTAVDVGAHVGLWTMHLQKRFQRVHSFEPVAAHRECFERNVDWRGLTTLHACALGDHEGFIKMKLPESHSSGSYMIDSGAAGDVPLHTLDSFNLKGVDFIKLDCEGYELFTLQGAMGTIERERPVIIVEQKPGRARRFGIPDTGALDFLRQFFDYRLKVVLNGDYIMLSEQA